MEYFFCWKLCNFVDPFMKTSWRFCLSKGEILVSDVQIIRSFFNSLLSFSINPLFFTFWNLISWKLIKPLKKSVECFQIYKINAKYSPLQFIKQEGKIIVPHQDNPYPNILYHSWPQLGLVSNSLSRLWNLLIRV